MLEGGKCCEGQSDMNLHEAGWQIPSALFPLSLVGKETKVLYNTSAQDHDGEGRAGGSTAEADTPVVTVYMEDQSSEELRVYTVRAGGEPVL